MKKKDQDQLRSEIWPDERDVFARPERLKYVRKLIKPKGCVFCAARDNPKNPESLVLLMSRRLMVILNKYPYNNGHLLILPRRHVADYHKLPDRDLGDMQVLMKQSIKILEKVYQPHGFNMGMNLGKVAGAGIPDHLHFHLIPRWGGDTNFFPLIAQTKLVVESVEQSYNLLKPRFERLEKKIVF